jgi:hypothetical protein
MDIGLGIAATGACTIGGIVDTDVILLIYLAPRLKPFLLTFSIKIYLAGTWIFD